MPARYGVGEGFATGARPRGISTSLHADEDHSFGQVMRIGIIAPSTPILPDDAEAVQAMPGAQLSRGRTGVRSAMLCRSRAFCRRRPGAARNALVAMANRLSIDAIWFARGGYGACRIAEDAVAAMGETARHKAYLGFGFGSRAICSAACTARTRPYAPARWSPMSSAKAAKRR